MPAEADNVAVGNVPGASPKATAACQSPAACRAGEEKGLWLQTKHFSNLKPGPRQDAPSLQFRESLS